jgi:hypothetical protein
MRMEGFCVGSWDSWGMRNGGWLREMVGERKKEMSIVVPRQRKWAVFDRLIDVGL